MLDYLTGLPDWQRLHDLWERGGRYGEEPAAPALPEELVLGLQCREHSCLLVSGGLWDQPDVLWTRMKTAVDTYDNWQMRERIRQESEATRGAHS